MPSLLPGYEYDIFISYRHNDNRSGWVTDFVNSLQEELSATIKDPLTIYFDKNPRDGLLEMHNADKSLEGKLKCLIFIPIISQTYCDVKSFAWQHEFCDFNKLSKEDQIGRDIKLSNGNVTSRILPIRIHDIDSEDKVQIEDEIGGILRPIEFIYKEPGVNRPLKISDDRTINQNKTDYRNQINKVANAIKEIIFAVKHPPPTGSQTVAKSKRETAGVFGTRKKAIFRVIILAVIVTTIYFVLSKVLSSGSEVDKSIVVLPFENLSNDTQQEYFSDGITEEIINALAQLEGLKVTGRTSSFQFKNKEVDLKEIGEKLGVANVLGGSIRKENDQLRITVQLMNAKDGYELWSQRFDRNVSDVFSIQDEIASAISSKLKITLLEGKTDNQGQNRNQHAYDLYLQGRFLYNKRGKGVLRAAELFKQAIAIDSSFADAYAGMAMCSALQAYYEYIPGTQGVEQAHKWARKALALEPNSSEAFAALGLSALYLERDWSNGEKFVCQSVALNPNSALSQTLYGTYLLNIKDDPKAAEEYARRAIAIDPFFFLPYVHLSYLLNRQGRHEEALVASQKAIEVNDNSILPYLCNANTLLWLKRNAEAIQVLESSLSTAGRSPSLLASLCETLAISGQSEQASKIYDEVFEMKESGYVAPYVLGRVSASVAKFDDAFKYLNQALDELNAGFTFWLYGGRSETRSLDFRNDPRHKKILERIALPEN